MIAKPETEADDSAFSHFVAGDTQDALRLALASLLSAPRHLEAAYIAAIEIGRAGRTFVAADALSHIVDAYARRGDLPAAVATSFEAESLAEDGVAHRKRIATAFGKGSPRVSNVSPVPPVLPARGDMPTGIASLTGDALVDRAEEALKAFIAETDPIPKDGNLPRLPLFASLSPEPLAKLLGAMQVKRLAPGEPIVKQGEDGKHAYIVVRGELTVVKKDGTTGTTLALLGPGAIFGEMALVSEAPRAASVRAVKACEVLAIGRDALEAVARKEPVIGEELGAFCRGRMVANLVRHGAILGALSPYDREELVKRFRTVTFPKGGVLIKQGSEPTGLFLVASGQVEVKSRDEDGESLRIATLGPGDVVGEISLVLRRPATADVVATHPTVALELTREELMLAIKKHPSLLAELYEMATTRDDETRSVLGQQATSVDDIVLI
jgi:CRP-like cAMP-binding protein